MDDSKRPTLPEMLAMPRRDGIKVNIPEQIGCECQKFGILLLHNENGQFVANIIRDNKENGVEDVNISIIREWLKGKGRLPVSWRTLIEVLLEMNLKVLADDVEGYLVDLENGSECPMDTTSSHSDSSRKRKLASLNPPHKEATGCDSGMATAETKKLKPISGHSLNPFADTPQPPLGTNLPPIGDTHLQRATASHASPLLPSPSLQLTAVKPELQLIPWREVYYKLRQGQQDAIINKILAPEKFDSITLGRSIMRCFQASQGEYQAILSVLEKHPYFSHAKYLFEKCAENIEADPLAAVPTMIMCSRNADDVHRLQTSLNSCCNSTEMTPALYCLAALFYSLSVGGVGKGVYPPRFHYLVLCSLEQSLPSTPRLFTDFFTTPGTRSAVDRPRGSSRQKKTLPTHKPTAEQMRILKHPIKPGEVLRIIALAGTGKTFVLTKIADNPPHLEFLYLVYNKSARREAEKLFPEHVTVRTVHSLAHREVVKGTALEDKILTIGEVSIVEIADYLNHGRRVTGKPEDQRTIKRAKYVAKTLKKFFSSSDDVITAEHVPTLEHEESLDDKEKYQQEVQSAAADIWEKMCDPEEKNLRLSHDGYLKIYQLKSPTLHYDCILVDEAQDFNPVMQSILKKQKCAKILVGDPHQQIYRFRGAVNAMDALTADETAYLTQSFRFGPTIGYIASCVLTMKEERTEIVIGSITNKDKVVTDAYPKGQKAIICRRNSTLFDEMVAVCTGDPSTKVKIGYPGGISKFGLSVILDVHHLMMENNDNIHSGFIKRFGCVANLLRYVHTAEDVELFQKVVICQKHKDKVPSHVTEITKRSRNRNWKTADVVFATAHKAKGLEFDTVQLGNDFFKKKSEEDKVEEDEVNVLYVAVTRAKKNLILSRDLALFLAQKLKEEFIYPFKTIQCPPDKPSECPKCGREHSTFPKFEKLRLSLSNGEPLPGGLVCKECLLEAMPFFEPML